MSSALAQITYLQESTKPAHSDAPVACWLCRANEHHGGLRVSLRRASTLCFSWLRSAPLRTAATVPPRTKLKVGCEAGSPRISANYVVKGAPVVLDRLATAFSHLPMQGHALRAAKVSCTRQLQQACQLATRQGILLAEVDAGDGYPTAAKAVLR